MVAAMLAARRVVAQLRRVWLTGAGSSPASDAGAGSLPAGDAGAGSSPCLARQGETPGHMP